jgi:NADH-quinone oxidoreductase subunit A
MPSWIAVVILIALALLFAIGSFVGTMLLKPRRSDPVKGEAYESGMAPIGDTRGRHNVRFYIVAMLFLVFDVELAFLYPWVVLYANMDEKLFLFIEALVFIAILAVGYVYAWRKGALDWSR